MESHTFSTSKNGLSKTSPGESQRVLPALASVLERFDRIINQIDAATMLVDDIMQTLRELAEESPEINALLRPVRSKSRRGVEALEMPPLLARSITLTWGPKSLLAVIDGQSVSLPPKPGMVLEILRNAVHSRDGWRTREELAGQLTKQTGRIVTKHALENLISRLKQALRRQARLDALIQCGPLGIRLALQMQTTAEVVPAPQSGNPFP